MFISVWMLFAAQAQVKFDPKMVDKASKNGVQASEGFERSLRFVHGWLAHTDSATGLIPTNLTTAKDIWEPHNSAADNWAFMVLTAYLLEKNLYNGQLLDMLKTERRLTSRVKSLPDTWSFSRKNFKTDVPDMHWVIFGTAEYMKDGIIPLCEYIGDSPWKERMSEMLNDLPEYYTLFKDIDQLGGYKVASEEVNGDMLQTLVRNYWMTGQKKFLDWAELIGDYYMLGGRELSSLKYLRLRDHGCEIIGGLSELYVTLSFVNPEKKRQYHDPIHRLLDRILAVGRNPDGLFYNGVNAATGEVVDKGISDNWGYVFDAFYSVYLIDHTTEYRDAFLSMLKNLNEKYRNFAWEGKSHDGYADALEGGINLLNREPNKDLEQWIESEMQVMFQMQLPDGIIGSWHGDGNFARTAIMYSLWKTQGVTVDPWRSDVVIGAERRDDKTCFVLQAGKDWEGNLHFDTRRYKTNMGMPMDYPRINQFPEWLTIEPDQQYLLASSNGKISGSYDGSTLLKGLPVKLKAGEKVIFTIVKKAISSSTEAKIRFAAAQEKLQVAEIESAGRFLNPRTVANGKVKYVSMEDWTSGFFPGSMWYMYDLTADPAWKKVAKKYTEAIDSVKYLTWHHDVGFMIQCSFGNGYRLGESKYKETIIQAAKSLSTRFRPIAGVFQSWNVDKGWQSQRGWECPVIIDNMMNLELLFNATRLSGDSSFYRMAVSHADQTIKNHYRPDHSCYHVVDYSLKDGAVRNRHTAQGYAHESSWARGQAWGIYGFTICYRETHDVRYLLQAQNGADFVLHHKNMPADLIPYWDFDAPKIPNEPRDVSAAAILASALYELSGYANGAVYKAYADKIVESLSSPAYRAPLGENGHFLLMHSVGSIPHGAEIDVPLNYADYYYLEALKRAGKYR